MSQVQASAAEAEGFRRLEEERRLRGLASALETAAAGLQAADRRASTVTAVQAAMQEALGKCFAGSSAESGEKAAPRADEWHDYAAAEREGHSDH